GLSGVFTAVILPGPVKVIEAFIEILKNGSLARDLGVSLVRVLRGYFFGAALGISLGIFAGLNKVAERVVSPVINVIRQIPLYAWMPLLILWFGIGEVSKGIIIAQGVLIPTFLNTIQGIHSVPHEYRELGDVLGLSKWLYIGKVILPSAEVSILTGLRLSAGNAWMAVVAAEMMGGLTGLGYALINAKDFMFSDRLIALMIVIAALGVFCDRLLRIVQKVALRWNNA
ncbi:MAG: ABC transporter permease, partial [Acetatifactor sp.]|nr:ABC transporter permease [Acetatifactor sp.]